MIAEVNGVKLFYEKSGEGRPLVMVHGNGEDHTIFDEAVRALRDDAATAWIRAATAKARTRASCTTATWPRT